MISALYLGRCLRTLGLSSSRNAGIVERNVEGFYDTISINGTPVFESISHYYPNVLTAMRTRDIAPQIAVTNRVDLPSYNELRVFGRKVIKALGVTTTDHKYNPGR